MQNFIKRLLLVSLLSLLAGCTSMSQKMESYSVRENAEEYQPQEVAENEEDEDETEADLADAQSDEFTRTEVAYETEKPIGSIVIDPTTFHLFLIEEEGMAIRYGVAVGREGFGWSGQVHVGEVVPNPTWTPPEEMIARKPELAQWSEGMPSGPDNPLGVLALRLYENERDTLYRIHGTNEPDSIGKAVSSGCIRMRNEDVLDLASRIGVGTLITVL